MPDVFISYARSDRKRAEVIAEALEAAGFSTWWDSSIPPEILRQQLQAAHAVIVCWSRASAKLDSVLSEATQGYNQQKLVPVTLQACDPPMPFNMVASADLTQWRGEADDEYWVDTLAEVRRLVEKGQLLVSASPPPVEPKAAPARQPARARQTPPPPPKPSVRAPRYQASRGRRKTGLRAGPVIAGVFATTAVLGAALWAGPEAFRYIETKLANPQQAAVDPVVTAPLVTEPAPVSAIPVVEAQPGPVAAAPPRVVAAPVRPKPSVTAPPSAKPPSVVAQPSVTAPVTAAAPLVMAAIKDVESCLRQIARACDAPDADFRTDGQFSAGERRLMATSLFPDGAQPTEGNLAACKAASTRRARNSPDGKAVCAAIR
ncbi:MAG TPA: TIR domain-containing protein [Caulobacterales bacterium]|nr:TIR domain-containing protein [Caulobacterales bacterium]